MNVRLAAQSMSKSNADAITFCRENFKLLQFAESECTSHLLYLLDKVFDILNSRKPAPKSHKSLLTVANFNYQTKICLEFCDIVLNMTYTEVRHYKPTKTKPENTIKNVKLLVQSARKREAVGLIISIQSILTVGLSLRFRQDLPLRYVMMYRFSQNLLEWFLNKIRARFGRNNNPNTVEFKHTMKAVWHQNLRKSSNTGNCHEQMADFKILNGILQLKRASTKNIKSLN